MCGIAGAWNKNKTFNAGSLNHSLDHRGPDSDGFHVDGDHYFFHTRLSIIDISERGGQPYTFKNLTLVFNGEIYNHSEIRKSLISNGYNFNTSSDTEVLIKAFDYWRERAVNHFIGMFAFAIYDNITEELFLFRDRVGIKPLYYAQTSDGFYFGSELRVFHHFPILKKINLEAVYGYFKFGYISNEESIFENIQKVAPGNFLLFKNGILKQTCYWSLFDTLPPNIDVKSDEEWLEYLEQTMISAFKYRMVSDVPVGVFLSGGIDSSLVTAILQKHFGTINTFTVGFKEAAYNESEYAKVIAKHLKTNHKEKILSIDEAKLIFTKIYKIFDEPFSDSSGIPCSLIASLARQNGVKVVISADGGDELFGGYNRYKTYYEHYKLLRFFSSSSRKLTAGLLKILFPEIIRQSYFKGNFEHKIYKVEDILRKNSFIEYYKGMISNQADGELVKLFKFPINNLNKTNWGFNHLQPQEQMMIWDFLNYLPNNLLVKVDRSTMYNSIEGREPFLDHRLVELAHHMPLHLKFRDGTFKYALKKILGKYLPIESFDRPKQGFSIPLFEWLGKEFDVLFKQYLSKDLINKVGFLNSSEVEKELSKYYYYKARGYAYNTEKIWRLLSFMMWWQEWVNLKEEAYI